MKVLIAVTHLLGAGHLTRAAALGRAFLRAGHEVTLISGGFPSALIRTDEMRLVQLPPVRSDGLDFRRFLDQYGRLVTRELLDARRALAVEAVHEALPDVVVTELFPFGRRALAREFEALVAAARALRPAPLIACSVRDVLVAPERPERVAEAHDRLEASYDLVLVHGDPDLVRIEDSWRVDERVRALVRYTGYVDDAALPPPEAPFCEPPRDILVSGGSSAASLPLYAAALGAARLVPGQQWRILVGRGIPEERFEALRCAAGANVRVERARPDFRRLLARAALSVSQAGYNTAVDLLRARVPAILVPFEAGRETEQRLRAERLAAHGFARLLPEAELSAQSLAGAVLRHLACPAPGGRSEIDLDGASRTVGILEEHVSARRGDGGGWPRRPVIAPDPVDWSPLDTALGRAADAGRPIAFWWRDDDAVAATPALERLVALRARYAAPLAVAAIPALVEPSLPKRLIGEPLTVVLVHGLAHRNHAGPREKKAEFGPQWASDDLARDAARALALSREAFGSSARAVFVPPWNRIAPDFVPALKGLGYRAVSAFADPCAPPGCEPLMRLDTHFDPVDWRGRRGLVDPDLLVARLARAVDARIETGPEGCSPLGLLTHHLVHDAATWRFCEALVARLALAPGAVLASVDELMAPTHARRPESPRPAMVNAEPDGYIV